MILLIAKIFHIFRRSRPRSFHNSDTSFMIITEGFNSKKNISICHIFVTVLETSLSTKKITKNNLADLRKI